MDFEDISTKMDGVKQKIEPSSSALQIDNGDEPYEPLDQQLFHLFAKEEVPDSVNFALKNRIASQAVNGKKRIDLWWMPAVINTALAFTGILIAIIFYEMARIGGSYTIIPNIIGRASDLWLKIMLIFACFDMALGWLATAIVIPIASGYHLSTGVKTL